jgi:hypothetical protein
LYIRDIVCLLLPLFCLALYHPLTAVSIVHMLPHGISFGKNYRQMTFSVNICPIA